MNILKGGIRKSNRCPFEVFGFRLFDKVKFNNQYYFIYGRRKSGQFDIRDFYGKESKGISYKKVKLNREKRNPVYVKH